MDCSRRPVEIEGSYLHFGANRESNGCWTLRFLCHSNVRAVSIVVQNEQPAESGRREDYPPGSHTTDMRVRIRRFRLD